jgi:hypothetical protein
MRPPGQRGITLAYNLGFLIGPPVNGYLTSEYLGSRLICIPVGLSGDCGGLS